MNHLLLCTLFLPFNGIAVFITVETTRGPVQGFDHDFGNDTSKRFFGYGQVFLGIPFAKPPVGERRFSLPEEICKPRCWQETSHNNVDEDCLYLNVITPHIRGNFPVMVAIHGGTFLTGGADEFHWKGAIRNLVSRGVVVVTIQYRLGLLGFFTTFTDRFPPNRGMYDQILALQWINEEIVNFGGDPSRITIFGQSAGAVSVSDLSLSPLARGLFHQLIQSSGSALLQLDTINNAFGSIHQRRASQICHINSTDWGTEEKDQSLFECLMTADPKNLTAFEYTGDFLVWGVAIDGAFFPDSPEKLAESRPKYPVLAGDMLEEFATFMHQVATRNLTNVTSKTVYDLIRFSKPYLDDEAVKNFSDIMIAGYSGDRIPADDDHLGWTRLITDMFTGIEFSAMISRDAQWHLKAGNEDLWLFTFSFRSLLAFSTEIEGWIPVGHGSELPYLWFYPEIWETYNASAADLAVANYMGGIWTHFAKNGGLPIPRAEEKMNYIEIGDSLTLKRNWRENADEVFNKQIPSYLGEFPPLNMSEETFSKLRKNGEKVLAKWNTLKCSIRI